MVSGQVRQSLPTGEGADIQLLVIQDLEQRRLHGIRKYGKPVQPSNGRNGLVDLYQELLDAAVYTRQLIEEDAIREQGREVGPQT